MRYVVLIRGINVGGSGKLPMATLAKLCTSLGCENVRTYIQSGNVVLDTKLTRDSLKNGLESKLRGVLKKDAYVIVKSKKQFRRILDSNPFNSHDPKKVGILFFDKKPSPKILLEMTTQGKEEIECGTKEIYIFFPDGMGRSKLKVPNEGCTMRNLNSVTKLANMLDD